jgi:hypothetical protein
MLMIILKILALLGAWLFFYKLLKYKNKKLAGTKASIITLLFAALIFRVSVDLYAMADRAIFSFNEQGEVRLSDSPLKIPAHQDVGYCSQFTDQDRKKIQIISERSDGKYCGEYWKFETDKELMLPYKVINSNQILYWASPSLKITGPKGNLGEKN